MSDSAAPTATDTLPGRARIVRRGAGGAPLAGLHPVLGAVYAARGIHDAGELDYSLRRLLPPDNLLGLDRAAALIGARVRDGGRILVIGDFDADGATSSALMVRALRAMHATRVDYLVPNRFEYGYGLTPEIVHTASARAPDLIVTVDHGIASVEGVARASELGIEVVVTDHHLPGDTLPRAGAIVNPNQPGDRFASKNLAGVGVAFYVLAAVRNWLRQQGWFAGRAEPTLARYLDLVALGTIADVVPLDANNRVLVAQGLQRIRAGVCCTGITALLAVAGRLTAPVTAVDLAFAVAPRLNAAGRLADMSRGIECLLCDEPQDAHALAQELHGLNQQRREIETGMRIQGEEALQKLELSDALPMALSFYDSQWHQGVIGILAARLREKADRPVVVFADDNESGLIKGSARSMPGVHIRDAIALVATRQPGLVLRFGGHAAAAGVTIEREGFGAFRQALSLAVSELLGGELPCSELLSDGEVSSDQLGLELAEQLRSAGVWGQGFPEPVFDGRFEVVGSRIVGGAHLKLTLRPANGGQMLEAIAFGETGEPLTGTVLHLLYRLEVNEFNGMRRAQLNVLHLDAGPSLAR